MILVEGFRKAKPLLTREIPFGFSLTSPESKDKTRKEELSPEQTVRHIIAEVYDKGDKALFSYTKKLDGVELSSLEITQDEISAAYKKVDKKLVSALKLAADRIDKFHSTCKQNLNLAFLVMAWGDRSTHWIR